MQFFLLKILKGDICEPDILCNLDINVPVFNLRNYNFFMPKSRLRTNYLQFEPLNNLLNVFNKNYELIDFNLSYYVIKKNMLS